MYFRWQIPDTKVLTCAGMPSIHTPLQNSQHLQLNRTKSRMPDIEWRPVCPDRPHQLPSGNKNHQHHKISDLSLVNNTG